MEPIASSSLSEEVRTAMSKLVKKRIVLYFICSVDFSNLAEEHRAGVKRNALLRSGLFSVQRTK